jgi:hypothetical protein
MNTAAIIERNTLADGIMYGVMDEEFRRHTVLIPQSLLTPVQGAARYTGDPHQYDQLAIGAVRLDRETLFHRIDSVLFDKLSRKNV